MSEEIIKKIQKLLALATSSNEHEAKVASAKAQELLVRHNLTLQSVIDQDDSLDDYDSKEVFMGAKAIPVQKMIWPILQAFFFVRVVRSKDRARDQRWTTFSLVGTKTNVIVAQFIYDFLIERFESLYKQAKKEGRAKDKTSYQHGLRLGLTESLQAARQKTETEMGLVLVKDPKIDLAINAHFGKTGSVGLKTTVRCQASINQGMADGSKIKLSRAIENDSKAAPAALGWNQ